MAREGKTIRFSQVVERSGQPQVHTLWMAPEKDPQFRRAQQSHRVMTVAPSAVGKTEVGHVGTTLDTPVGGQFLIFPKSLKPFEGARVVGIKFDLIEQPKLASLPEQVPSGPPKAARRIQKSPGKPAAPKPTTVKSQSPKPVAPPADATPPPRAAEQTPQPTATPPAKPDSPKTRRTRKRAQPTTQAPAALLRAVKAAMKDLQQGKPVAAYQRLERATAAAEQTTS